MPDTNFAVVDGYSSTLTKTPLKNLNDLVFAANEGSYLVGVAAALKTKAKHVGFVGGVPGAVIGPFEAGYQAGVKSIDPSDQDRRHLPDPGPDRRHDGVREPGRWQGRGLGDVREGRRRRLPRGRQVRSRCLPGGRGRGRRQVGHRCGLRPVPHRAEGPAAAHPDLGAQARRHGGVRRDQVLRGQDPQAGLRQLRPQDATASATPPPAASWTTSSPRSTRRRTRSRAARSSFRPTPRRSSSTRGAGLRPAPHRQDWCPGDALTCRPGICRPDVRRDRDDGRRATGTSNIGRRPSSSGGSASASRA